MSDTIDPTTPDRRGAAPAARPRRGGPLARRRRGRPRPLLRRQPACLPDRLSPRSRSSAAPGCCSTSRRTWSSRASTTTSRSWSRRSAVAASTPLLVGLGLLRLRALFALSEARFWPDTGNVWLVAMPRRALVWWHISQRDHRTQRTEAPDGSRLRRPLPPPRPPPAAPPGSLGRRGLPAKPSLFAPVLGALLGLAGLLGLPRCSTSTTSSRSRWRWLSSSSAPRSRLGALTQRRVGGLVVLGLLLLPAFGVADATGSSRPASATSSSSP